MLERLTASEERYHGLFTHLSEGFALHEVVHDAAGRAFDYRFLAANAALERAVGHKVDQMIGRGLKNVISSIDQSWLDSCAEVVRTGEPARGFVDAVAQCGARLAEGFPRAPGEVPPRNELEDAIRASER